MVSTLLSWGPEQKERGREAQDGLEGADRAEPVAHGWWLSVLRAHWMMQLITFEQREMPLEQHQGHQVGLEQEGIPRGPLEAAGGAPRRETGAWPRRGGRDGRRGWL